MKNKGNEREWRDSPWKNRNYTLLWGSQVFSQIGEEFYSISLIWYFVQHEASAATLSLIAIPYMVAGLFFYVIGGFLADRYRPRSLMVTADIARIFIVSSVVISVYLGFLNLLFFLGIQFFLGVFTSLFHPSKTVLIKEIVCKDLLGQANAISDTTFRTIRILAPMTTGFLGAYVPLFYLFMVNVFCYLISAGFIWAVKIHIDRHIPSGVTSEPFFQNIYTGLIELRRNRMLLYILIFGNIVYLGWMYCWNVGFPLLAKEMGHGSPNMLGTLISFYGIGNLLGSLLMMKIRLHRYLFVLLLGVGIQGIGFLNLGLFHEQQWITFASAIIAGFGGPFMGISVITAIQTLSEIHHIGKIYGINMLLFTIFSIISNSLGTVWFNHWSVGELFSYSGIFLIIVYIAGSVLERIENKRVCVGSEVGQSRAL
jgi:MFS transporter, DHA3 family, macrolide efflux protein